INAAPVASLYCFATFSETFYYLGGFDPDFAKFSPGTVLTAHAIRYAIENDRSSRFDFLRGNESYKYKWGAVDRHNVRLALVRGRVGNVLTSAGAAQLRLELRLKDRMHARFGGAGKPGAGVRGQESGGSAGNNRSSVAGSRSVGSTNVVAPIVPVSGPGQTEADR
ncbi:MAG: GNAT family N-acetyltransferase, partial [Armatimonadaceae bacterium]